MGVDAVPHLLEHASSPSSRVRARVYDILGDIGPQATSALPTLRVGLTVRMTLVDVWQRRLAQWALVLQSRPRFAVSWPASSAQIHLSRWSTTESPSATAATVWATLGGNGQSCNKVLVHGVLAWQVRRTAACSLARLGPAVANTTTEQSVGGGCAFGSPDRFEPLVRQLMLPARCPITDSTLIVLWLQRPRFQRPRSAANWHHGESDRSDHCTICKRRGSTVPRNSRTG